MIEKKWDDKRRVSAGRVATGAMLPGLHGAVAGKPGHKLKAAGTEVASAAVLPVVGTAAGTYAAGKMGWYKPQAKKKIKKSYPVSAFGVDHGI